MKRINVLILARRSYVASNDLSRSMRERVIEPISLLEDRLNTTVVPEEDISTDSHFLDQFDVLFLSRHKSEKAQELVYQFKKIGKKVVYDLDDLVTAFPANNIAEWNSKDFIRFSEIISSSDLIIFSNMPLLEKICSYINLSSNKKAVVPTGIRCPSSLPIEVQLNFQSKKMLFINGDNLKFQTFKSNFFKSMNNFQSLTEFKLHVISDTTKELDGKMDFIDEGQIPWLGLRDKIIQDNYCFAISPLGGKEDPKDLDFYKCKTPIKYLQYGSIGLPCIYSKTPVYTNIIKHEYNGLIANNSYEDWMKCLKQLSTDNDLRKSISQNAYNDIRENFSLESIALRLFNLLEELTA